MWRLWPFLTLTERCCDQLCDRLSVSRRGLVFKWPAWRWCQDCYTQYVQKISEKTWRESYSHHQAEMCFPVKFPFWGGVSCSTSVHGRSASPCSLSSPMCGLGCCHLQFSGPVQKPRTFHLIGQIISGWVSVCVWVNGVCVSCDRLGLRGVFLPLTQSLAGIQQQPE